MKNTASSLIALAAALALSGGTAALAQSTRLVTINASVPEILNLSVDNNAVTLALAQGDYNPNTGAGTKEALAATTFQVSANRNWTLAVVANSANFTYTGQVANPSKPCADLSLRTAAGAYASVTTTQTPVATGTRGGFDSPGNSIPVDYQLRSALQTDPPGAYALTLTFTLTGS